VNITANGTTTPQAVTAGSYQVSVRGNVEGQLVLEQDLGDGYDSIMTFNRPDEQVLTLAASNVRWNLKNSAGNANIDARIETVG